MIVPSAFGVADSIGKRKGQEDHVGWSSARSANGSLPRLTVLADGMGGHVGGAVASSLACEAFLEHWQAGGGGDRALRPALDKANARLAQRTAEQPDLEGMGCTLVALELDEAGTAYRWISVGDSMLFSVTAKGIARLNEDHSFRSQDTDTGGAERDSNVARNVLQSAVTGGHIAMVDDHAAWQAFQPDETLILASDGIETIGTDQILALARQEQSADVIAASLVAAVDAAEQPRQDNVTVAVLKAPPRTTQSPAPRRSRMIYPIGIVLIMLALLLAIFWFSRQSLETMSPVNNANAVTS